MRSVRLALGSTALASSLALAACGDGDKPDCEVNLATGTSDAGTGGSQGVGDGGTAGTPQSDAGTAGTLAGGGTAGSAGAAEPAASGAAGMPEGTSGAGGMPGSAGAAGTVEGTAGAAGEAPTGPDLSALPNYLDWASSAHARVDAEAFAHWNEDDPAVVSTACARCHSGEGYQDFLGADGSEVGSVEIAPAVGSVVDCNACHNAATETLDTVTFPSGVTLTDLGPEARCMNCHQGRASSSSVTMSILTAAAPEGTAEEDITADNPDIVVEDDTVYPSLGFTNIHYYAAGATLYAGEVMGGYQYEGQVYDWRFRHAPGYQACVDCHNSHTLEVKLDECSECHTEVESIEDLRDIRMVASLHQDYDGDGDTTEGIAMELEGLREQLLETIQALATQQEAPICYAESSYPYFLNDADGDGTCSEDELAADSARYVSWTPRLLRAAYNFQLATKDPGAFAHNAKYVIQLLHDSIMDVNGALTTPADLGAMARNDFGHFNGAGEAARHWDEDEEGVRASCSKCHGGAEGLRFYLEYGVGLEVEEQANGLDCSTCHESFAPDFDVMAVDSATFPGGTTVSDLGPDGLCSTCHSGRESGADIRETFADGGTTTRFMNVHYLAAGATRLGSESGIGYEYAGMEYSGKWTGHLGGDNCIDCHQPTAMNHSFQPAMAFDDGACAPCHSAADDVTAIRGTRISGHGDDFDADGSATETLAGELDGLRAAALDALWTYALATTGTGICVGEGYPYWFVDNAEADASTQLPICGDEDTESFTAWDEMLMAGAHNIQISMKETGVWAHNFNYMAQLLIDTVDSVSDPLVMDPTPGQPDSGDETSTPASAVLGLIRPEPPAAQ